MLAAFALAALAPPTAIDAERAFNADAQAMGQWRAFEKWADPDAVMFVPAPTGAHAFLKGREDPPVSVVWMPAASWVSCDGLTAVNTGPSVRRGGKATGYFTTVWHKGADGWRWLMDHGDGLDAPMPAGEQPVVKTAACTGRPVPPALGRTASEARGASADGTLTWRWTVAPDGRRTFAAELWDGARYRPVVANQVAGE